VGSKIQAIAYMMACMMFKDIAMIGASTEQKTIPIPSILSSAFYHD